MHQPDETVLNFHCGVCAKQLTDATALFTSCGHFYCFKPQSRCTRLRPNQHAGRCEQCGKECQAGCLTDKGSRYDSRVRSFVFSDLSKDLRTIAEIIEFRNRHLQILGENAAMQQKEISKLTANCKSRNGEIEHLRAENEALKSELSRLKKSRIPTTNTHYGDPVTAGPYEMKGSDAVTVIELDPPASSMPQIRNRVARPSETNRINRNTKPDNRTQTLAEQSYDRSLRTRSIRKRRESQVFGSRLQDIYGSARKENGTTSVRRRWDDRTATEARYEWSKGKRESASRFGNQGAESVGAVRDPLYNTRQRFTGDWQRKVSTVPRPSATPDKLRRRVKRSVLGTKPLGKPY